MEALKMKKKKWLIPLLIIAIIAVLCVVVLNAMASKGFGMSVGRYLVTKNGESMLVVDNSPIVLSNRTEKDLFEGLEIGDEILVIHDGIAETYPAKTGAYAVFKKKSGTAKDIPKDVIESLTELGWLSEDN